MFWRTIQIVFNLYFLQEVESRKRGPSEVSQSVDWRLGKTPKPTRGNVSTVYEVKTTSTSTYLKGPWSASAIFDAIEIIDIAW